MQFDLNTPIEELPGIGKTRAKCLSNIGIQTVGQMVYHFPRGYQFRGNVKKLSDAVIGETVSFQLIVASEPSLSTLKRGMTLIKLRAFDDTGTCEILFFNQPYLKNTLKVGFEYRFFGRLTSERGKFTLTSPIVEPIIEGKQLPNLVAVYPLTAGISQKMMTNFVTSALRLLLESAHNTPNVVFETLPEDIRIENHLCTLDWALKNIHFPPDFEALNIAKKRLIFEELYNFALGAALSQNQESRTAPKMSDTDISPLISLFPFEFTGAQKRAISEISKDLASEKTMRRLVAGDVGSGKTAIAEAAAYIAVKNGFQCAIMAPTEILATQHFNDISILFSKLGINVKLLTSSTKPIERKSILEGLATGSINAMIGTHSLISDDVKFKSLGLVICDEQHRFGVNQREALIDKNSNRMHTIHSLLMSATPIPRTLAMFLYGNLDMSTLDELPPGRQLVKTFLVNESYRMRLNAFIQKQHDSGNQTYVICPAVEPAESGEVSQEDIRLSDFDSLPKVPPKAATELCEELKKELPNLKIECVHGKMKTAEKDAVMRRFSQNEIDVLVSTTVIEVGVNVPNATLMIIENAERFGLSQLHQLRGRVGRGNVASTCVLVSDCPKGSKAERRLNIMRTIYDGFKIAEFDLNERGPGDFIPNGNNDIKQHGALRFRLANLCENIDLFESAIRAASKTAEKAGGKTLPQIQEKLISVMGSAERKNEV